MFAIIAVLSAAVVAGTISLGGHDLAAKKYLFDKRYLESKSFAADIGSTSFGRDGMDDDTMKDTMDTPINILILGIDDEN